jgi:hypothetical protein
LAVLDEMFDAPGFYSEAWVQRDPSFAALRADPGYAAHFQRWTTQKGDALLGREGRGRDPAGPAPAEGGEAGSTK